LPWLQTALCDHSHRIPLADIPTDTVVVVCTELKYFEHVEEMEWAIEVATSTCLPVAATMCVGPDGDMHGVSAGECAVRMARAGK